jgi:hypothetical protein
LPMCEGHKVLCDEVDNRVDAIRTSLYYLSRWIRVAQRHRLYRLEAMLGQHRVALKAEFEDLKTSREQETAGRYSMDLGPYTLSKEGSYEPHWLAEAGRRSDRFNATIVALEEEIDDLYIRMEELVLPLLTAERERAYAEHKRLDARGEEST